MRCSRAWFTPGMLIAIAMQLCGGNVAGQFAPGKGLIIVQAGDDFEDPQWNFIHNFPKSSSNIDGNTRLPQGVSSNGRWEESLARGQPDIIDRVTRPAGGLPGSAYSIRIRSLNSGVPGSTSGIPQQDDIIGRIVQIPGVGVIPVTRQPSLMARIRIPPPEQWEWSTLQAFSFRVGVEGTNGQKNWPGIFFQLNRSARTVTLIARANEFNADFALTAAINYDSLLNPYNGWMTVGFSFTADGRMHYYAGLGAGNLGDVNLLNSRFPGNQPVKQLEYFFSSTVNTDNGVTWGPEFHLDDVVLAVNDGTVPQVPLLKNLEVDGANYHMTLSGLTLGAHYRIQHSDNLEPESWTSLERVLAKDINLNWSTILNPSPSAAFFRVVVDP